MQYELNGEPDEDVKTDQSRRSSWRRCPLPVALGRLKTSPLDFRVHSLRCPDAARLYDDDSCQHTATCWGLKGSFILLQDFFLFFFFIVHIAVF